MDDSRVEVIPKFINTPIDVLAIGLFDSIAPLSLKVAAADGKISPEELEVIKSYFVEGWGVRSPICRWWFRVLRSEHRSVDAQGAHPGAA